MRQLFIAISLLFLGFALTQCGDDEKSTGRLSIELTDKPFPTDMVSEANVTITKIEARQKGVEDSEFIVLSEESASFNLLDLTNGVTANLVDLEVPVGAYDLVRLYVSEASIVLSSGESFDLNVPSGAQTGIKIFIKPEIVVAGGLTSDLILDFDVSRSFKPQGSANSPTGFIFSPVIKATNESIAGSLGGTVLDSLDAPAVGAQISVYAADTLNTTSFADESGNYEVLGLEGGLYDLIVEFGEYEAVTEEDIEIVVANRTTQDFKLEN